MLHDLVLYSTVGRSDLFLQKKAINAELAFLRQIFLFSALIR